MPFFSEEVEESRPLEERKKMLPFQFEAPAAAGQITPAEAALRQRQRMLQMGVFVCCLLLLLDTRAPPPGPSRAAAKKSDDPAEAAFERTVERVDAALAAGGTFLPMNVTGYYHGDWTHFTKDLNETVTEKGMAILQLEMIRVPKLPRSISVVRGLVVLAADSASTSSDPLTAAATTTKKKSFAAGDVSVSAFGVYLHSYGRVALVANVGSPYTTVELRWTRKNIIKEEEPPESVVVAPQQKSNIPPEDNDLVKQDDVSDMLMPTKRRFNASGRLKQRGLDEDDAVVLPPRQRRVRRRGGDPSFIGERKQPTSTPGPSRGRNLFSTFFASSSDQKRRLGEEHQQLFPIGEEPRTSTISLTAMLGEDSPFESLEVLLKTSLPPRARASGKKAAAPPENAELAVKATSHRRRLLENGRGRRPDSMENSPPVDDEVPMSGSLPLVTGKPLAYATRPFLGDVYRGGKCAMLVDVEVVPPKHKEPPSPKKEEEPLELAAKVIGGVSGCGVDGTTVSATANRVDWELAKRAALGYSLLMTTVCVFQIGLLFRQLHFSRTQAVAARVSLLCIAAQSLIDAVLCVANLLLCAVLQNLFAAFAAVAFFELVIFCVVEMRYVVVVFQAHDPQRFWMQASTRRQLAVLHAQFYFALFASLCAVYAARDDVRPVLFLAYAFWIPQIVRNVRHEHAEPFHDAYLYGMAITRLVPPLYVYLYPYSLVAVIVHNAKLRPGFCLLLMAWQAAQVAVLKAQTKFGPRCFVPPCFLPARYDYRRPLPPAPPPSVRASETNSPSSTTTSSLADRERGENDTSLTARSGSLLSLRGAAVGPRRDAEDAISNASSSARSSPTGSASVSDGGSEDNDRERGFECSICFQFVLPSNRDHFITPCDHVRSSFLLTFHSIIRSSTPTAYSSGCYTKWNAPSAGVHFRPVKLHIRCLAYVARGPPRGGCS